MCNKRPLQNFPDIFMIDIADNIAVNSIQRNLFSIFFVIFASSGSY